VSSLQAIVYIENRKFNYEIFDNYKVLLLQRLVKSLSTDEAVWEAVMNNEVVQQLRGSISSGSSLSFHLV